MGSPTCPTCGLAMERFSLGYNIEAWRCLAKDKTFHPYDATPTPPAPADDAGCIIVKSPRPCPDCDGKGWLAGDPCPLCSGIAPGEREDARLKHQRAVEKARRADDASGAEAMRAAFLAWINAGYLVHDAVTPVEWDDEGLPLYYTRDDGVRHYLDGEWHAWQAARAPLPARADAVREARERLCNAAAIRLYHARRMHDAETFDADALQRAEVNEWAAYDALRAAERAQRDAGAVGDQRAQGEKGGE